MTTGDTIFSHVSLHRRCRNKAVLCNLLFSIYLCWDALSFHGCVLGAVGKKGWVETEWIYPWKWKCMNTPGNWNAWIHQFCPKPLPPGSTVCCVCCEQGEDLFSQNLLLTASASFRRDLHKTEQQPLPFIKLCTAASATDLRSFLELGIPLMDIPASPFQAPCVLKDSHFN